MKKAISLVVALMGLSACVTSPTNNPVLSDAHIAKCQALAGLVVTQDNDFKPALSISSLISNQPPVAAEDFKNGVLTCSIEGASDTGYAIAYDESSEIYLYDKFNSASKKSVFQQLIDKISAEEQRLQDLEQVKQQQPVSTKRESAKDKQIQFCLDFGARYADILKTHGMTITDISVHDSWDSGSSVTCVNNYKGHWTDELNDGEMEPMREQHIVDKTSGEYQTIFR
ncbi:hypothetical protein QTO01_03695 [Vibrio mytili]|uniref:Lipoprotein n=1 Tax=Vibrio mytili TaxID=50718 RepID=A0A0C3ECI9_9VIBR|nr:hypothetical protein [Vibrio mytili]KIN12118.1 hypothetical protein SU60_04055 [Vibrio mytili]